VIVDATRADFIDPDVRERTSMRERLALFRRIAAEQARKKTLASGEGFSLLAGDTIRVAGLEPH
jgi:hypothetical protein